MIPQQEGHDNSGFAMVIQDLGGVFAGFKDKPLMSLACTQKGISLVENYMETAGFKTVFEWVPRIKKIPGLDIKAMPHYRFKVFDYPDYLQRSDAEAGQELLTNTRLAIRALLEKEDHGYIYSFWPDVLTLKEIGDPSDIATYFRLWDDDGHMMAKNIVVQCRQNTNYDIVRYAAHPFFLQGYTLCANGENTFYTKNKEYLRSLGKGYIGFESDSQTFLYTLHYVLHTLKWPIKYYKHVITPLPLEDIEKRDDKEVLNLIRHTLGHLEINGPNTIIGMMPDGSMITCCDSKKLRPVIIGGDGETMAISSEVCGLNAIFPHRNHELDVYPNEREIVVITPDLEVQRWKQ